MPIIITFNLINRDNDDATRRNKFFVIFHYILLCIIVETLNLMSYAKI